MPSSVLSNGGEQWPEDDRTMNMRSEYYRLVGELDTHTHIQTPPHRENKEIGNIVRYKVHLLWKFKMFHPDLGRIQRLPKEKEIGVHDFARYYPFHLVDLLSSPPHSALCSRMLIFMDYITNVPVLANQVWDWTMGGFSRRWKGVRGQRLGYSFPSSHPAKPRVAIV